MTLFIYDSETYYPAGDVVDEASLASKFSCYATADISAALAWIRTAQPGDARWFHQWLVVVLSGQPTKEPTP